MTIREAAAILGVAPDTVYRLCRARHLSHYRVGAGRGRIVIDEADVRAYQARRRVEAIPPDQPLPGWAPARVPRRPRRAARPVPGPCPPHLLARLDGPPGENRSGRS